MLSLVKLRLVHSIENLSIPPLLYAVLKEVYEITKKLSRLVDCGCLPIQARYREVFGFACFLTFIQHKMFAFTGA